MKLAHLSMLIIATFGTMPAAAQAPMDAQCSSAATQATGYVPGSQAVTGPNGRRVAGAARGAVVGEAVSGDAKAGAAAGVAVAGSRNRQDRRQGRRAAASADQAWQNSYNACLQQKSAAPK